MKGHNEKILEQDRLVWMFNQYTLSAVSTAVEHCLAGGKAKSEYIKKPLLQEGMETKIYKESNEEIAIYEMKQRINLLRKSGLPESPI